VTFPAFLANALGLATAKVLGISSIAVKISQQESRALPHKRAVNGKGRWSTWVQSQRTLILSGNTCLLGPFMVQQFAA